MSKINRIVLHCSDSEWGTAVEIDRWHRERGWRKIGYMGVILNGYPMRHSADSYWDHSDGSFEWGRPLDNDNFIEANEVEAHAFGINRNSVGLCLIGEKSFSMRQLIVARKIIRHLCDLWGLTYKDVIGHYEVPDANKPCPNINMDTFRKFLVNVDLIDDLMVNK